MGRKHELALSRSSQRCRAYCRAQVLRPLNFVQLTLVRVAVAKSSGRFMAVSVSSASRNDGLQPLQNRPTRDGFRLIADAHWETFKRLLCAQSSQSNTTPLSKAYCALG